MTFAEINVYPDYIGRRRKWKYKDLEEHETSFLKK